MADGVFSHRLHTEEIRQLLKGDFKQIQRLDIDLSAAGFPSNAASRGLFEIEGNCIILLPRTLDFDGRTELVSSVAATSRVYVRINHQDNPWIPMSLIAGALDLSSIAGTIARFWIYIPQATAGGKLYFVVTKGVSLASSGTGQGPAGGGYGTPSQTDPGTGSGGTSGTGGTGTGGTGGTGGGSTGGSGGGISFPPGSGLRGL